MDILRKMFKNADEKGQKLNNKIDDEYIYIKKPQAKTDEEILSDELKFTFQIFTNSMEPEEHFERQMQQILEAIIELEDSNVKSDKNSKTDLLKPGCEESFFNVINKEDEMFVNQLDLLNQSLNEKDKHFANILPRNKLPKKQIQIPKKKLTDEEIIMGKIHGTLVVEECKPTPRTTTRQRAKVMAPLTRSTKPFGGAFVGNYQVPKIFGQRIISKTVRKPDGSYETTKITEDSQGNRRTTVILSKNGKSETFTFFNGVGGAGNTKQQANSELVKESQSNGDRNIYVTKEGYAVPRNLW